MKHRTPSLQSTRLLDQPRERVRYLLYRLSTEKVYLYWVRFFIRWHGVRHTRDMGAPEVEAFLSMLTKDEVAGVLALLARLLCGTGMRLMEGVRLRVKDVDFDRRVIIVREAKGGRHAPHSLIPALRAQKLTTRAVWEADRQAQCGGVEVPHALEVKYPRVGHTWGWFWLFPSPSCRSICVVEWNAGITCMRNVSNGRSNAR